MSAYKLINVLQTCTYDYVYSLHIADKTYIMTSFNNTELLYDGFAKLTIGSEFINVPIYKYNDFCVFFLNIWYHVVEGTDMRSEQWTISRSINPYVDAVCHTLHENNVTFEQLFDSVSSIHDTVASIPTINILTPTDRFSFGDFSEIYTRISHIKNASMRYLIYIHAIVNDLTKYRPLSEKYVYDTVQIFKQMSNRNLYPFVDAIPHISFFHELSLLCLGDMLNSDAVWLSGNIADYANEFKKMHNKDMHPLLVPIAIYDVKLSVANELYEERRKWINWFLFDDLVPSIALKQYEHAKRIELSQARTRSPPHMSHDGAREPPQDDAHTRTGSPPHMSHDGAREPPQDDAHTRTFILYNIRKLDSIIRRDNNAHIIDDIEYFKILITDVSGKLTPMRSITQNIFDLYRDLLHDMGTAASALVKINSHERDMDVIVHEYARTNAELYALLYGIPPALPDRSAPPPRTETV